MYFLKSQKSLCTYVCIFVCVRQTPLCFGNLFNVTQNTHRASTGRGERWPHSVYFVFKTIGGYCEIPADRYNRLKLVLTTWLCFIFLFPLKGKHLKNNLLLFRTLLSLDLVLCYVPTLSCQRRASHPTNSVAITVRFHFCSQNSGRFFTPSSSFCPLVCSTLGLLMIKQQNLFKYL